MWWMDEKAKKKKSIFDDEGIYRAKVHASPIIPAHR